MTVPALRIAADEPPPPAATTGEESPGPRVGGERDDWLSVADIAAAMSGPTIEARTRAAQRIVRELEKLPRVGFVWRGMAGLKVSPVAPAGTFCAGATGTITEHLAMVGGKPMARLCGFTLGPNLLQRWPGWFEAKRRRVFARFQLAERREERAGECARAGVGAAVRDRRFNVEARELAVSLGLGKLKNLARAADEFRRRIKRDKDPDTRGRPEGGAFMPAPELAKQFAALALDPNRFSLAEAVRFARGEARRLKLANPSKATWARWFTRTYPALAVEYHRAGRKRGEADCVPKARRALSAAEPLEVVELDGHRLDVMYRTADLRGGWRRRRQGTLVFAIDVATQIAVGDIRENEGSAGVAACIYTLLTTWGRPQTIRSDNGRAIDKAAGDRVRRGTLDNPDVNGICAQLGIRREGPPPFHPWGKGCAERFAGTVKNDFSRWFASFWGGSPRERPEGRDRETREDVMALPTLADLRAAFARWLGEGYLSQPRDCLGGLSPRLAWEQSIRHIERVPQAVAELVCALPADKGMRKYGRDGVTVKGWLFRVRDTGAHVRLATQDVQVRCPPHTGDYVLVCNADGRVVARAQRVALTGVHATADELREVAREQGRCRRELRRYGPARDFTFASRAGQLATLKRAHAMAAEAEVRAKLPPAASPDVVIVRADLAAKAGTLGATGTDGRRAGPGGSGESMAEAALDLLMDSRPPATSDRPSVGEMLLEFSCGRERDGSGSGAPSALDRLIAKARAEELAERARVAEPTVGARWAQLGRERMGIESLDGQGGVGA